MHPTKIFENRFCDNLDARILQRMKDRKTERAYNREIRAMLHRTLTQPENIPRRINGQKLGLRKRLQLAGWER